MFIRKFVCKNRKKVKYLVPYGLKAGWLFLPVYLWLCPAWGKIHTHRAKVLKVVFPASAWD